MKNKNNIICFDIITKVIVDGKNIGYSDFKVKLDSDSILSKILKLEFTFGKVFFKKKEIIFKGINKENSAKICMKAEDLKFIKEAYKKQQPRIF